MLTYFACSVQETRRNSLVVHIARSVSADRRRLQSIMQVQLDFADMRLPRMLQLLTRTHFLVSLLFLLSRLRRVYSPTRAEIYCDKSENLIDTIFFDVLQAKWQL